MGGGEKRVYILLQGDSELCDLWYYVVSRRCLFPCVLCFSRFGYSMAGQVHSSELYVPESDP